MKPGNVFFVYTVDGEELILTYLKEERGFLIFKDGANTIALRPSSINTVIDTYTPQENLEILELKKEDEGDIPTEVIHIDTSPKPQSLELFISLLLFVNSFFL